MVIVPLLLVFVDLLLEEDLLMSAATLLGILNFLTSISKVIMLGNPRETWSP
jgi:hypothetical protein